MSQTRRLDLSGPFKDWDKDSFFWISFFSFQELSMGSKFVEFQKCPGLERYNWGNPDALQLNS